MADIALSVNGLSKDFVLPHERKNSLKEVVLHFGKTSFEYQHALHDINFEVKKGEFFGIVGRNGSGKSTLLKLIGGIYQPTKGSIVVNGTLTPFIELGIGFNPELTGRENVYLNGAILGLTRKEVEAKYDEIVDFAEIERFMDQKLKNYSSGMQVRLAFSIAMQAHNDILLIDEVLAVGDAAFQRKCYNTFSQIKKSGKTVVFVTHDMGAVQNFCDRAIMLEDSKIVASGKPREIALRYEVANLQQGTKSNHQSDRPKDPVVRLDGLSLNKGFQKGYTRAEDIEVVIDFTVRIPTAIQLNVFLVKDDGRYLAGINSTISLKKFTPTVGSHRLICKIKKDQLPKGLYRVNTAVYSYIEYPSNEVPELVDILDSSYGIDTPFIKMNELSPTQNGEFNMQADWQRD